MLTVIVQKEHKKIERLILFSEVAKHLNFSIAAEQLGISRGHLSAQIKRLEQEIGLPLLIRSTRSVRLTQEGERVLQGMNTIKRELLALERTTVSKSNAIEGLIKITAPPQFTERFLLKICNDFKQQYLNIEFSIDCSYTSHDLNRSDFDLAFRSTNTPPENMIAKALFSYQYCCCASPQYWQIHGKPEHLEDLINHQCLQGNEQHIWQFGDEKVKTKGWLQVNDGQLLKKQALANEGVIYLADYLVKEEITKGQLITALNHYQQKQRQIFLIHPQLIHQSKRVSAFVAFTKAYFL